MKRTHEPPFRFPAALHTERLLLRCWQVDDAAALRSALQANVDHLSRWIPERISTPLPLAGMQERITTFVADFEAGRAWRYAILARDAAVLVGEASLFPRSITGRVPYPLADRLEIGYWLRADFTGRGYATEAAQALLALAASIPGMTAVEIRCDERNAASAAVPQRLGFRLSPTKTPADPHALIWSRHLPLVAETGH